MRGHGRLGDQWDSKDQPSLSSYLSVLCFHVMASLHDLDCPFTVRVMAPCTKGTVAAYVFMTEAWKGWETGQTRNH